jgi:aerobic-type carbon monoxide dehydrogenase small subunit (CoxS/CutS family)
MKRHVLLNITVNGVKRQDYIASDQTLLSYLRENLGLTGAKKACGAGECGACTVLLENRPIYACITLALQAQGKRVETIEGLAAFGGALHPLQQAFIDVGAVQCGFCTPGFIMSGKALLERNHHPRDEDIKEALAGNLCRCTGYAQILEAIKRAAEILYGREKAQ